MKMQWTKLVLIMSFCLATGFSIKGATLVTKLTASDGDYQDRFGKSVAISGGIVVVGAPDENNDQGAAYVFVRSYVLVNGYLLPQWNEVAKLVASDGAAKDGFGCSVSIYGTTILVGASGDDVQAGNNQGSVYRFEGGQIQPQQWQWSEKQQLIASDGAANDFFGNDVAIDGTTAVIAAPSADGDYLDQGAVYVFVKDSASGVWNEKQILNAKPTGEGDHFGHSVAINGNWMAVGVPYPYGSGGAYVFNRYHGVWTQTQVLVASDGDPQVYDAYGWDVAIWGNTLVVGSPAHGPKLEGAAYVYKWTSSFNPQGNAWVEQTILSVQNPLFPHLFLGYSVAISDNAKHIILGAPDADQQSASQYNVQEGSVYVFMYDSAEGWFLAQSIGALDYPYGYILKKYFGYCVAASSDTLVVGAPQDHIYDKNGFSNPAQGSAYIYQLPYEATPNIPR